ncbi:MAG TPA: hypothetical protein VF160_17850 [Candidatus Dormibacteraeota bacterium]
MAILMAAAVAAVIVLTANRSATTAVRTNSIPAAQPITKSPGSPPPANPDPTPVAGIFDGSGGAFPSGIFACRNRWVGQVGTTWRTIYAGATPADPALVAGSGTPGIRYIVNVYDANHDIHAERSGRVDAPAGAQGGLKIQSVSANIMTLVSDSGQTLHFDVDSLSFV